MNKKSLVTFFCLVLMALIFIYLGKKREEVATLTNKCDIRALEFEVRGTSMSGLFDPGQSIEILKGYYQCNKVSRNDIVAFINPRRDNPIIKQVMVVPGDTFKLKPTQPDSNEYYFLVNNENLKNYKGENYAFTGKRYQMLKLYENSFKGIMPQDTYFVFGTSYAGSIDSTRFGPVLKQDLIGKVRAAENSTAQ